MSGGTATQALQCASLQGPITPAARKAMKASGFWPSGLRLLWNRTSGTPWRPTINANDTFLCGLCFRKLTSTRRRWPRISGSTPPTVTRSDDETPPVWRNGADHQPLRKSTGWRSVLTSCAGQPRGIRSALHLYAQQGLVCGPFPYEFGDGRNQEQSGQVVYRAHIAVWRRCPTRWIPTTVSTMSRSLRTRWSGVVEHQG